MVDRKRPKCKPQTPALAFCLVFVDIKFLPVSLKYEKFHVPVKLFLGFQKPVVFRSFHVNLTFCLDM